MLGAEALSLVQLRAGVLLNSPCVFVLFLWVGWSFINCYKEAHTQLPQIWVDDLGPCSTSKTTEPKASTPSAPKA